MGGCGRVFEIEFRLEVQLLSSYVDEEGVDEWVVLHLLEQVLLYVLVCFGGHCNGEQHWTRFASFIAGYHCFFPCVSTIKLQPVGVYKELSVESLFTKILVASQSIFDSSPTITLRLILKETPQAKTELDVAKILSMRHTALIPATGHGESACDGRVKNLCFSMVQILMIIIFFQ